MGVTQSFYARFAEWLAARGYLAATFDYRGIVQSEVSQVGDRVAGRLGQQRLL